MRLNKRFIIITSLICATVISFVSPYKALANSGTKGDHGGSGGGTSLGSKAGGGWIHLDLTDEKRNNDIIIKQADGTFKMREMGEYASSDTIRKCDNYDGVYVSTWFYKGKKKDPYGTIHNYVWDVNGMQGAYAVYRSTAVKIEDVKAAYDLAEQNGDIEPGTTWNNVSWFCGNKDLNVDNSELWGTTQVLATADGISYDSGESDENGYAGLKISSDSPNVTVTFRHYFSIFTDFPGEESFGKDARGNELDPQFSLTGNNHNGNYIMKHQASNGDSTIVSERDVPSSDNVAASDAAGCKVTSCGILTAHNAGSYYAYYDYKYNITSNDFTDGNTNNICSKVKYKTTIGYKSGDLKYAAPSRSTKGCIKVQMVGDPGGDPDKDRIVPTGSSMANVRYTAEEGNLSWSSSAKSIMTRRLAGYDTISYLVNPSASENTSVTKHAAKRHPNGDLCSYIKGAFGATNILHCARTLGSGMNGSGNTDNTTVSAENAKYDNLGATGQQNVVAPTTIGAKYCTTRGLKYEYWYAHQNTEESGPDDDYDIWQKGNGTDYWFIFPSGCAGIAKKPQVAIWNGSIFSPGGITTVLSPRYSNTAMETLTSDGGEVKSYGSWAEYMAIGGGNIDKFSSAAGLTEGSSETEVKKGALSNLTITNNNDSALGNSGITVNGAYQDRMIKYLRDKNGVQKIEGDGEISGKGIQGTEIWYYTGNLKISGDIKSNTTSIAHNDRGNLPQMIIFVDGNVTITSNVTQIDAWLIVKGNLNTCAEHADKMGADGVCNTNQLKFNGPVSAGSVSLNRSYGADINASTPAEIFNMRPDAYIWAYNQSLQPDDNGGYDYKAVYSRELAPRY